VNKLKKLIFFFIISSFLSFSFPLEREKGKEKKYKRSCKKNPKMLLKFYLKVLMPVIYGQD